MKDTNKELIKKLYSISEVIYNLYNKIKINEYKGKSNEENISNLKIAIEYERSIYNSLKLEIKEVEEICDFLEIYSKPYIYDMAFNKINDITKLKDNIENENYFKLIGEEKMSLIYKRIINNLAEYLINKKELFFDYEEKIIEDEYENYTGIYIRKFKQEDEFNEKQIRSFLDPTDPDCFTKKQLENYKKILKKEALFYKNHALSVEHVIIFDFNKRKQLEDLAYSDFHLAYIKKINEELGKDSSDVIDQTYNLSFIEPLIEDKIIFGNFLLGNCPSYRDETDSKTKKYLEIVIDNILLAQTVMLIEKIIYKSKKFINKKKLELTTEFDDEINIFDKTLMELVLENFNEDIIKYILQQYNNYYGNCKINDINELKELMNKKLNKPKTKSKALIKNDNMLK